MTGADWSREEVEAVVGDYFAMLTDEIAGRLVVVADVEIGNEIRIISARPATRANAMPTKKNRDPMRREYDFTGGVRGKYAARVSRGSVVVVLAPDVAAAYPTSAAVNRALRAILKAAPARSVRKRSRS